MRNVVKTFLILLLVSAVSDGFAVNIEPSLTPFVDPTKGQSEMIHAARPGDKAYVDWIVTTIDITSGYVNDANLVFADILGYGGNPSLDTDGTLDGKKGTVDIFRNYSAYYYFYQIENPMVTQVTAFTLNLDPNTVLTAGYINTNIDLDTGLGDDHDLSGLGEYEGAGGLSAITACSYDPSGTSPNLAVTVTIPQGYESYIFFVTCASPPRYDISSLHAGAPALDGELPIPMDPETNIPEPATMILFISSVAGYLLRRSRN